MFNEERSFMKKLNAMQLGKQVLFSDADPVSEDLGTAARRLAEATDYVSRAVGLIGPYLSPKN